MTDWLSEIEVEDRWKGAHFYLMARALRELAELVEFVCEDNIHTVEEEINNFRVCGGNFSEYAKELCVAARESSREE